jgi:hypothetical protein
MPQIAAPQKPIDLVALLANVTLKANQLICNDSRNYAVCVYSACRGLGPDHWR